MIQGAQTHAKLLNKTQNKHAPTKPTTTPITIDLLMDLKELADKHGGLESLNKGLTTLQRLRN